MAQTLIAAFELILESLGKKSYSCRFGIIFGDFLFFVLDMVYFVF